MFLSYNKGVYFISQAQPVCHSRKLEAGYKTYLSCGLCSTYIRLKDKKHGGCMDCIGQYMHCMLNKGITDNSCYIVDPEISNKNK